MGKVQVVPKQLTDKEELERITKETLAITKKNDKELSDDEKLVIRNSEKLNAQEFPIIFPMRATIGFMVRNMDGKNHQAIEFIRAGLNPSASHLSLLTHLVREFDELDENSQSRVDCLDWLVRRGKIGVQRFLEAMVEGIAIFNDQMTKAIIASRKPDLAEKILKSAQDESLKSAEHKKLAAKIAKLTDDKPLVQVDTGNKIISDKTVVLSFSEFAKDNDKLIRGQTTAQQPDYVDGEVVE